MLSLSLIYIYIYMMRSIWYYLFVADFLLSIYWCVHVYIRICQIQPGQVYSHEINLCFISVGHFHFQVCCIPRPYQTSRVFSPSPYANSLLQKHSGKNVNSTEQSMNFDEADIVYWCNKVVVIEAVPRIQDMNR